MNWKTLSSTYLFRAPWFTVRKDVCETPSGKIVDPYYVYEFPVWVTALALTREDQCVMVRQYRHGLGQTILEIPGGCVDPEDRDLEAAIARELLEETGYRFDRYMYLGKVSANPSTNNNWMHMFLATGGEYTGARQLDENEEIEVVLLSLEELRKLLKENGIVQAMHVSTIYYALEYLRQEHAPG